MQASRKKSHTIKSRSIHECFSLSRWQTAAPLRLCRISANKNTSMLVWPAVWTTRWLPRHMRPSRAPLKSSLSTEAWKYIKNMMRWDGCQFNIYQFAAAVLPPIPLPPLSLRCAKLVIRCPEPLLEKWECKSCSSPWFHQGQRGAVN